MAKKHGALAVPIPQRPIIKSVTNVQKIKDAKEYLQVVLEWGINEVHLGIDHQKVFQNDNKHPDEVINFVIGNFNSYLKNTGGSVGFIETGVQYLNGLINFADHPNNYRLGHDMASPETRKKHTIKILDKTVYQALLEARRILEEGITY